ncbi:MAG TPA: A/G-specific adenine glycosylase [Candidatus Eremiobacteraceae bacterium]|nr:A/G-specific adenine glycosylase [Candidatus Eremiobacteraceae bacterium]
MSAPFFLTPSELKKFRTELLGWFATYQRDLPWRRDRDPYRIWISEVMLQQTRVAAVIPYFEKFCARFPDVRTLAEAAEADVLRMWSGLGYYSRARNLQAAAQQIVREHGGTFPTTEDHIRGLRGIGKYTTNAILSIAFGKNHAVVEGNVARVVARLEAIRGDLREGTRWESLQRTADRLLEPEAPGAWNQAMMELGATICTPRSPQCLLCPVAKFCRARKLGLQEVIPEKRKKRATVAVLLAAAVLVDARGRCILLPPPKKSTEKALAGDIPILVSKMWHFPTTAVSEDAASELRRYLKNVMGATGLPSQFVALPKVRHAVTYRAINLLPFRVEFKKLPRIAGAKVILLKDFSLLPVSNLTRKVARAALESADIR